MYIKFERVLRAMPSNLSSVAARSYFLLVIHITSVLLSFVLSSSAFIASVSAPGGRWRMQIGRPIESGRPRITSEEGRLRYFGFVLRILERSSLMITGTTVPAQFKLDLRRYSSR